MTTEISKNLMCVQIRNGIELWVEAEKAQEFQKDLVGGLKGFCQFDGQIINTADVVGIFNAQTIESFTRRKNGEWFCKSQAWHGRGEKCECSSLEDKKLIERREQAIKNCDRKCSNGYIYADKSNVILCECIKSIN